MSDLGRKTLWTLSAIASFLVIMLVNSSVDPFQLGMGLGLLLAPTSVANAVEHRAKNGLK